MVVLIFLTGLASITVGVAYLSIPAAWITAGAGLIVMAAITAMGGKPPGGN